MGRRRPQRRTQTAEAAREEAAKGSSGAQGGVAAREGKEEV